jgi:WD40 repeat protein
MTLFILQGYHTSAVLSLCFPDNRHLCSCSSDGSVKALDTETINKEASSFRVGNLVTGMCYVPSSRRLITADLSGLYSWDWRKHSEGSEFYRSASYLFLTFSNGIAVFADPEKGLLLIDLMSKTTTTIPSPNGDLDGINTAAYSSEGKFLVTGGSKGMLRRWDLGDQRADARFDYRIGHPILSIAVSTDGKSIAVTASDNVIRVLDASNGSVMSKLKIDSDGVDQHLLYSKDGKMLVSIEPVGDNCQPSLIRFWDIKEGKEICSPIEGHEHRITSCCLSPDNSLLVTGSSDGTIIVWKVPAIYSTPKKQGKRE